MAKDRTRIPSDIEAEVLFQQDHTCCVCNERERHAVQIHHIDGNPTNHDPANLAVLCLLDHERTLTRGGFSKHLKPPEVVRYRDAWVERVAARRREADAVVVQKMAGTILPPVDSRTPETPAVETPAAVTGQAPTTPDEAEALLTYINSLPTLRAEALKNVPHLAAGDTTVEMKAAGDIHIDVLQRAWVHLASWFPARHFGELPADEYMSQFSSSRSDWHWALIDATGTGEGLGTGAGLELRGAVIDDLMRMIAETVKTLAELMELERLKAFDFDEWKKRWDPPPPTVEELLAKLLKK